MNQELIFFDTETGGLDPEKFDIIEMAAVRIDAAGNVVAQYSDKICPTLPVDPKAAQINGYSEESWKNAVSFENALETLKTAILRNRSKSYILVAYNEKFDQAFFRSACKRIGEEMPFEGRRWVDPMHMAWPLLVAGVVPNLKLGSLVKYFGVSPDNLHTALGDTIALAQVYERMMKRYTLVTEAEGFVRNVGKSIMEKGLELISGTPETNHEQKQF
jgi:DNA polymerase III epsilon subunit-like protein